MHGLSPVPSESTFAKAPFVHSLEQHPHSVTYKSQWCMDCHQFSVKAPSLRHRSSTAWNDSMCEHEGGNLQLITITISNEDSHAYSKAPYWPCHLKHFLLLVGVCVWGGGGVIGRTGAWLSINYSNYNYYLQSRSTCIFKGSRLSHF